MRDTQHNTDTHTHNIYICREVRRAEMTIRAGTTQLEAAAKSPTPMMETYVVALREHLMRLEDAWNVARSCSVFKVWKQAWSKANHDEKLKERTILSHLSILIFIRGWS